MFLNKELEIDFKTPLNGGVFDKQNPPLSPPLKKGGEKVKLRYDYLFLFISFCLGVVLWKFCEYVGLSDGGSIQIN